MLDLFTILTKGGFVLWQKNYAPISGSPVEELIKNVLIEERAGTDAYTKDSYTMKWTFANEHDLIFVVAYQKILQLNYTDELLETTKRVFLDQYQDILSRKENQGTQHNTSLLDTDFNSSFGPTFEQLRLQMEEKYSKRTSMNHPARRQPRKFEDTKKFEHSWKGSQAQNKGELPLSNPTKSTTASTTAAAVDEDEIARNIRKLKLQGVKGRPRKSATPTPSEENTKPNKKKSQKQARVWDGQITKDQMKALDYSNDHKNEKATGSEEKEGNVEDIAAQFVDPTKLGQKNKEGIYEVQDVMKDDQVADDDALDFDSYEEEEEDREPTQRKTNGTRGGMFSYLKSLASGKRAITNDMLEPVIATIKERLITQNVATDIADHLCQSVRTSLLGKKLGSFERLSTLVKDSMEAALKRILTPKTSLDLLRDIEQANKAEKRPYSICFIGVNGVGKSTNLSKVCFWLLQNNYKILIAACDTFRSGAVEQLRVHVRNLTALQQQQSLTGETTGQVEIFERGYGKDAAGIAKDAISYASSQGFDVVLIDTAGRMQDNEPLMRALSKLVSVNQPDKIIFVGEALVGNEAVDQLTKFNQALKDFSGLQHPRHIDGMILTKFDTIDDKVGAALSMTYITGQPIYFVGTGQTYTDLKNLKVSHVVHSLLKK
ncbi:SRP54-type protein [Mycotypha africana]|uniref:SRP54-type protein n=1 Tax=Mycotypha africana TaxID=64632 RepID=UPI0023013365|nr:SRP54-type protein [Mycotypha africana]KAI8968858.1 SRP54-type protein [Mycotypha africana]